MLRQKPKALVCLPASASLPTFSTISPRFQQRFKVIDVWGLEFAFLFVDLAQCDNFSVLVKCCVYVHVFGQLKIKLRIHHV